MIPHPVSKELGTMKNMKGMPGNEAQNGSLSQTRFGQSRLCLPSPYRIITFMLFMAFMGNSSAAFAIIRPLAVFLLLVTAAGAAERIHVVEPGERVPRLEWVYGVSAAKIRAANGLESDDLVPGARIIIPGGGADGGVARAEPVHQAPPVARAEPVPVLVAEPIQTEPEEVTPEHRSEPTPVPETPVRNDLLPASDVESATRNAIATLSSRGLRYNGRWTPPGEKSAWAMDCSNTARWLLRETRQVSLPRTASDQYEFLRKSRRLWRVRGNSSALRKRLEPGDLLFWENTYRPVRKPPITHVMVYLGTDNSGQMWMAGSQSSKGPNVYRFNPEARMGGYRFFWFFRRDGRFVAYGRP